MSAAKSSTASERASVPEVVGAQEFASIARGVLALDAMVKAAPVSVLAARVVTPGKIVVVFTGDVASVEAALQAGRAAAGEQLIDELFISNLHPAVVPALRGEVRVDSWDALGIVESYSVACGIETGDVAAKEAEVVLTRIRLEGGMGGKATVTMMGALQDVEASVRAAADCARRRGLLCEQVVIPRPHPDMRPFVLESVEATRTLWR